MKATQTTEQVFAAQVESFHKSAQEFITAKEAKKKTAKMKAGKK